MALVARALDYFQVREDLINFIADLDEGKHHQMGRVLEQLVALRLVGGEAVSDTTFLNDPALMALFEWYEVAHPSTFGRRLGEMCWHHNLGLSYAGRTKLLH